VDSDKKSATQNSQEDAPASRQAPDAMDEFFTRLQSDMRRPDLSQDAITEAFHAIQRIALENDTEDSMSSAPGLAPHAGSAPCANCGNYNPAGNRFCGGCGAPIEGPQQSSAGSATSTAAAPGQHFYHHHYHHHYFAAGSGGAAVLPGPSASVPSTAGGQTFRARVSPGGNAPLSRAETAVRQISRDWAQACNTKHLDDLVSLYSADAVVLRPNLPPVRGTAALRELFFAVLDAGLGEVEFEPLRVDMFGEVACEAGRCKMLVPVAMGKRREERGKYLMVYNRQNGEWKITADSWSSDLSLSAAPQAGPGRTPAAAAGAPPGAPRK